MGLIHTPRVIYSSVSGLLRPMSRGKRTAGLIPGIPHVYKARVGVFDVDYLGHLNNAAYLNHAELARWNWTAQIGILQAMVKAKNAFVVTGSAVRYRREVAPFLRQFEVHSSMVALDDRELWLSHTFHHSDPTDNKIRAQVLMKAVLLHGKKVVDPREFFRDVCDIPADIIEDYELDKVDPSKLMIQEVHSYKAFETCQRASASADDESRK